MLFVWIIVYIHTTTAINLTPFNKVLDNQINSIAQCIYFVINAHQIKYKPVTILYDVGESNEVKEKDMSKAILDVLVKNKVPLTITNNLIDLNITESNLLILIFYKTCKSIMNNSTEFNKEHLYLIIIEEPLHACEEILKQTSDQVKSLHVTFMIHNSSDNYVFVTTIPEIDANTCEINEKSQLVQINECNNGILHKRQLKNIYPSKVPLDYKKCPFKIGLATMFPYSMIKNKKNLKNFDAVYDARGSDVEMTKIITDNINATLQFHYIYTVEENAYTHMEYLAFLLNGTLDACAGGLYRIYGDLVDYSGIYTRQSIMWVYYVEREIRSWQSLIKKINGLYYFLLFYLCHTIIWKILSVFDRQADSLKDIFLYSWGALVGSTSLLDPRSLKKKLLNLVYLIMTLHLSAYISAQIFSYLTIQKSPQTYKTVDELRESNVIPYLAFTAKYFVKDKKHEAFANLSKDCNDFNDCLTSVLKYKGSTILLDSYLTPFQASTAVNDEAVVLSVPQSILIVYHEMIVRKNHPVAYNYKEIVTKLFEAGIVQKLYNDAIGITTVHKSEIFSKNIISDSYSCTAGCAITLPQSAGIFYVWMIGCLLSFFIFLIEILLVHGIK